MCPTPPFPLCKHRDPILCYTEFSFHIDNKSSAASSWAFTAGSIGASIMFESFHCIAWNFVFPTNVEKFLWRLSSRLTILIPLGFTILWLTIALCTGSYGMPDEKGKRRRELAFFSKTPRGAVMMVILFLFGLGYILARLYAIVEVFRSLFFLPPEAFKTTEWLSALPSVG
jgi:hypothetical protein